MPIILAKAELIGGFLETLAYGAYLTVFGKCAQVLRHKRLTRSSFYLTATALALFMFITIHFAIDLDRNFEAFTSDFETPNTPILFYEQFNTYKNILKSASYVATTIVSDAFMLYRCFIVWGKNIWIIAFPFLIFLADIGVGILWTYTLTEVVPGEDIWADNLSKRVKTFYAITLAFNVLCTTLISYRIWVIQRHASRFSILDGQVTRALSIIIESGAVYSGLLSVLIACIVSGTPVMFIFLNSIAPVIGIVFSSVIIRVGSGTSHGDQNTAQDLTTFQSANIIRHSMTMDSKEGVQINLDRTVHTHVDEISISYKNSDRDYGVAV